MSKIEFEDRAAHICNEARFTGSRSGCLVTPDPAFTMDFSDIGYPPILWCSFCGPGAKKMNDFLDAAYAKGGMGFVEKLETEVVAMEEKIKTGRS